MKVTVDPFRPIYPTPAALITSVAPDGAPDILTLGEVLRQPALNCALVGAKSPAQVEKHLGAVGVTFAADELAAIDRILADAPQG